MAVRNVNTDFWSDIKVADTFTADDKYFWLFLLTTRYGNLVGCFELSLNQARIDLSFENTEKVKYLLDRFEKVHEMIRYDYNTSEVLILNWFNYNSNSSPYYMKRVTKEFYNIKSKRFREYISEQTGVGAFDEFEA